MKTEKFYLASSGQEVKIGDVIKGSLCKDGVCGILHLTIDNSSIPVLLEDGIIKVASEETDNMELQIITRIANRLNWKPKKVKSYLNNVATIMPMATFNIILREIAIMLDEKYPDHINKSEKIYCISSLDGRIHEIPKGYIKNYRNFAAFRTIEDAKIACNILKGPLKEMFKSGK